MQDVKTKPSYLSGVVRRLSALRLAMAPIVSLITLCAPNGFIGVRSLPRKCSPRMFCRTCRHSCSPGCCWAVFIRPWPRATRLHPLAVLVTGALGCIPAVVTYYKLKLRGEPFFPWDLSQVSEASDVMGKAGLELQTSMWVSGVIFAVLFVLACFIREPKNRTPHKGAGRGNSCSGCACAGVRRIHQSHGFPAGGDHAGYVDAEPLLPQLWRHRRLSDQYSEPAGG